MVVPCRGIQQCDYHVHMLNLSHLQIGIDSQDHVVMGVLLTKRDTFLTKAQYSQILYLAGLQLDHIKTVHTCPPAIMKPQPMWTGKQASSRLCCRQSVIQCHRVVCSMRQHMFHALAHRGMDHADVSGDLVFASTLAPRRIAAQHGSAFHD